MVTDRNSRIAPEFSRRMVRLGSSWSWVKSGFAEEFHRLRNSGAFSPEDGAEVIWRTRHKFVVRSGSGLGFDVVYKGFSQVKNRQRYVFRPSPAAAEAINYQRLSRLGIPLPELLAVGDDRCCFLLRDCFMVTRFADGFRDGRDFYGDGPHSGDRALMMEFLRGHLELLATVHDAGILHRGFTPANLLYRNGENGLELCWIDLASCRKRPVLPGGIADDLVNCFRFLDLSAAERRELESCYLAARGQRLSGDALSAAVEKRLRKRMKR